MYESEKLNYSSLEPYISNLTLTTHYNEHYLKYLNKLNEILNKEGYNFRYSKEELFNNIDDFNIDNRDSILFNLGGVVNHELYFKNMSDMINQEPMGKLKDKIDNQYGSYDDFKKEFKNVALKLVGSGYTFLVINDDNNLQIINMSNQESPYMYGLIPLIALDLWEHAYYLDYKNNKEKYIDAFFTLLNFEYINSLYEEKAK